MTVTELIYQLQELVRMGIVGPACTIKIRQPEQSDIVLDKVNHVVSPDFTNKAPYILLS